MAQNAENDISELLQSWGLGDLKAKFKANFIVLEALEYLTEEDIIELIPKIGQRAIFRGKLLEWRKKKIAPVEDISAKKIKLEVNNIEEPQRLGIHPTSFVNDNNQLKRKSPQAIERVLGRITIRPGKPRQQKVNNNSPANNNVQSKVHQFYIPTNSPPPLHPIPKYMLSPPSVQPVVSSPNFQEFPMIPTVMIPHSEISPILRKPNSPTQQEAPVAYPTTDVTPFVTSIIRVETNCENEINANSNASPPSKINRTTILQKLNSETPTQSNAGIDFKNKTFPQTRPIQRIPQRPYEQATNKVIQQRQEHLRTSEAIQNQHLLANNSAIEKQAIIKLEPELDEGHQTPMIPMYLIQKPPNPPYKPAENNFAQKMESNSAMQQQAVIKLEPGLEETTNVTKSLTNSNSTDTTKNARGIQKQQIQPRRRTQNKFSPQPQNQKNQSPHPLGQNEPNKLSQTSLKKSKKQVEKQLTNQPQKQFPKQPDTQPETDLSNQQNYSKKIPLDTHLHPVVKLENLSNLNSTTEKQTDSDPDDIEEILTDSTKEIISLDSEETQDAYSDNRNPENLLVRMDSEQEHHDEKLDIRNILLETDQGRDVLVSYETFERLDNNTRKKLIELIVENCWKTKRPITLENSYTIAEEIIEVFPNERLEDYYHRSKRGKRIKAPLYKKYTTMPKRFFLKNDLSVPFKPKRRRLPNPNPRAGECESDVIIS